MVNVKEMICFSLALEGGIEEGKHKVKSQRLKN